MKRLGLLLALLLTSSPALAQPQPAVTLRIGAAANETYAQAYYALDNGFFKAAGFDVEITTMTSGAAITAGVLSGALDIGGASTAAIANAHARGLPLYLIAPAGVYSSASPTSGLIVAKTSPLRTAKDLAGKTIAVTTLRDIAQDAVMAWIDKNGGDSSKSQYIELPASEMDAAVSGGRVDAAFVPEPNLSQAKADTRVFAAAYDGIAKQFMVIGWLSSKTWLDRNPAPAKKFIAVMKQTGEWAKANPKGAAEILAKYSKLPIELVQAMHHTTYVGALDPALIQPVIDVTAKYKTLPTAFDANELLYPGLR